MRIPVDGYKPLASGTGVGKPSEDTISLKTSEADGAPSVSVVSLYSLVRAKVSSSSLDDLLTAGGANNCLGCLTGVENLDPNFYIFLKT